MSILNLVERILKSPEGQKIFKPVTTSTPTPVDVSAEGMKKKSKTLTRGTGVTYSGVKTSSQGLLTGAITDKKTLLGG
jgi:hypothetical protein